MKYIILVSHGTFAPGLHNAAGMMLGQRSDICSTSLMDGMDTDTYRKNVAELLVDISADDEVLLFADIIGGSPLSIAMEVLTQKGLLKKTVAVGGMNLPMILNAAFADNELSIKEIAEEAIAEAKEQIKPFVFEPDDEEDI